MFKRLLDWIRGSNLTQILELIDVSRLTAGEISDLIKDIRNAMRGGKIVITVQNTRYLVGIIAHIAQNGIVRTYQTLEQNEK